MRQAYRILPVYTGDVSGVCSALYELGGMTVMHDPSGCNSTYNTHDETRWYDRDSLIFLSGLCEPDAIMGNDEKFIDDVVGAAQLYAPKFIALCNSPIPYLNGTDFAGISTVIEQRTGIPAFYIPTNGMHDYVGGAGPAFENLAHKLFDGESVPPLQGRLRRSVNILGMTPLDFAADGCTASLKSMLNEAGWEVCSSWAMDCTLEELRRAPEASVNLAVSSAGMRTARYLREKFGTPWVAGIPVGRFADLLIKALDEAVRKDVCGCAYKADDRHGVFGIGYGSEEAERTAQNNAPVILIGEPVVSCSIAEALEAEGRRTYVIAATEESAALVRGQDLTVSGEEETENAVSELLAPGAAIIADPLYQYVCPDRARFIPVPHLAFSGRLYRSRFRNPFEETFMDRLISLRGE